MSKNEHDDDMPDWIDDEEEILSVAYQLQQRGLYGAAQMICRLARERDEARKWNISYPELAPKVMRKKPDIKPAEKRGVWTKQMIATRRKLAARLLGETDEKPDIKPDIQST
jgi:hypothetical protein